MSIEPKKPIVSSSKSASKDVDPKSLNTISEGTKTLKSPVFFDLQFVIGTELESPGDCKAHNLSGIRPLDETADTSPSLRVSTIVTSWIKKNGLNYICPLFSVTI